MSMENPQELFVHELTDMLDAEKRILSALGKLQKKVSNESLCEALRQHEGETENQIQRLEEVFESIDEKAKRQPCKGMTGLVAEAMDFFKEEKPDDEIGDLFAVGACKKVEHYEITAYESLIEMARQLGCNEAVPQLEENLREEQAALEKLEELGQEMLSQLASQFQSEMEPAGGEEEEEEDMEMAGGNTGSSKRGRTR